MLPEGFSKDILFLIQTQVNLLIRLLLLPTKTKHLNDHSTEYYQPTQWSLPAVDAPRALALTGESPYLDLHTSQKKRPANSCRVFQATLALAA